ncbi:MAG: recombinase RecT [Clostridia bacterium]|nr:recombinase RecT [Clostridia bacterium]
MSNELVKKEEKQMVVREEKNITDNVLNKIHQFQSNGQIYFPNNYSPENALKSAWLKLQEVKDKNGKLALEVCTQPSIANALLNMVIQGLNPMKNQCYFIPFGNQLTLMRSYFGSIAVAKQFGEIREITAEVIYEGDKVETQINRGKTTILSHTRSFENINKAKIIGAYATILYNNDAEESIIMTIDQIKTSWKKSKLNPESKDSTHSQFTEDMCKRTVINKICKYYINTKDDSNLNMIKLAFETSDEELKESEVEYEIQENANKEYIDIETGEIQETEEAASTENVIEDEVNTNSNERPSF